MIQSSKILVGPNPVNVLDWSEHQGTSVLIRNSSEVSIFIGGSDVTSDNGMEIEPGEDLSLKVPLFNELFLVSNSEVEIQILRLG